MDIDGIGDAVQAGTFNIAKSKTQKYNKRNLTNEI